MNRMFALAGIGLLLAGCSQVNTGFRGVETCYGRVCSDSLTEGLYWYNPWSTDIYQLDTRQQKWGSTTETYTRDVQKANVTFAINFHLNPSKAHIMYARVGADWKDNIIPQMVAQSIKNEFGRWDAVKVVENRGEVAMRISNALRVALARQDIILDSFDLTDIKYTGAFEEAVEDKQVAIQTAIREQNNTIAVTERGKQQVITAEANAKALKATSDALESNPKLIEYEAIKKWNGSVPSTLVGSKAPYTFMLNKDDQ